jgi:hypothetical protein
MTTTTNPGKTKKTIVWLTFTLVLLIAFFFRFYRLGNHPLGIFFDPAINGLDAVRLIQRGGQVLFFPTNGGREALFMYLLTLSIRLFDTTPFALRAPTATISLLTVALLFGFLRSMRCLNFDKTKKDDFPLQTTNLWFTALATLTLATMYWHIAISRLGQRPILVPMLAVPLFWFFLKGWATGQKKWFVLSGIFMGLEGYTYPAARLLPVILLVAVLPEFFLHRAQWKTYLANLVIFAGTALTIYLPMAWYLLAHPAQFAARAGSVMVWNFLDAPTDIAAEIGQNIRRVLGFFCCEGSPNPIFGLPGWPGLSILLMPFLLVGLIMAIKKWRHLFYRLVAGWWLIGIFPSIIAIEAPHPLRMIVAVVPTAVLVGLGLVYSFHWLWSRVSGVGGRGSEVSSQSLRFTFYALPFLLILATIPGTYRAYFIHWTARQETQGVYDYGAIALRNTILNQPDNNTPIYLPLARFNNSTLLYYLSGTFAREAQTSVSPENQAMVISPEINEQDAVWVRLHNNIATVLPPLTDEGQQLIQAALAGNSTPIKTGSGETIARMATLSTDPAQFLQQPTRTLEATFGPVRLTGVNYQMVINPSTGQLPVTLFWQAAKQMSDEYEVIVQLVDDHRQVWGDGSGRPNDWAYPTTFWRPQLDEIASRHIVKTDDLPPGRYWLAVSLFDPVMQQRLPLTKGISDSPDTLFIGPLKVPLPPPESALPFIESIDFGEVARLIALDINPQTIAPGEAIIPTFLWQALSTPADDYTVFVHLLDENGNLVATHDAQPLNGIYPTSIWTPGELVLDSHQLPIPNSLTAGQYRLAVGLYHQPTGQRVPVISSNSSTNSENQIILPTVITVE